MEERSNRVCILWMHGWAVTAGVWPSFFASAPDRQVRNVPLDVACWFREAEGDDDRLMSVAHRAVVAEMHTAWSRGEKVWLGGWSLGAMLAIRLAAQMIRNGESILPDGLLILSGTLQFCTTDVNTGWPKRVLQRMIRNLSAGESTARQVIDAFRQSVEGLAAAVERLNPVVAGGEEQTIHTMHVWSNRGLIHGLEALMDWNLHMEWTDVMQHGVPIWWGHGGKDTICPPGAFPAQTGDRLTYSFWPDGGHALFLSGERSPEVWRELLASVLTSPVEMAQEKSDFRHLQLPDKKQVAGHFSRHAAHYAQEAWIQREMQQQLWTWYLQERTAEEPDAIPMLRVADIGCGPGEAFEMMAGQSDLTDYTGIDIAGAMLDQARETVALWSAKSPERAGKMNITFVCADAEQMVWPAEQFDLIYSNAVMQWFHQPEFAIGKWIDALECGGWLAVSVFGADTFRELREAAAEVLLPGEKLPGPEMKTLDGWRLLLESQCADRAVLQIMSRHLQVEYPDVRALLKHIQRMGASDASAAGMERNSWTPRKLKALESAYRGNSGAVGPITATYEQIFWLIRKKKKNG